MNFGAAWLLAIYAIFFIGLVIMAIAHLILVWRFAKHSWLASSTSGAYIIGIGVIVIATFLLLSRVDWAQSFDLTVPGVGISLPEPSL